MAKVQMTLQSEEEALRRRRLEGGSATPPPGYGPPGWVAPVSPAEEDGAVREVRYCIPEIQLK